MRTRTDLLLDAPLGAEWTSLLESIKMSETPVDPLKKIQYSHLPVLRREVVEQFNSVAEGVVVDGTLGLGGHSEALLERYPRLTVLGVEWDAQALDSAQERLKRFGDRFRAVPGNYADLPSI